MAEQTIDVLVDGGKASGGPPLGPALGPTGVNVGDVVNKINEKTKDFEGMKVPVKVIIDAGIKTFRIEIGTPPTSELIKKELGLDKGTKDGSIVGDLKFEQLVKIANMKKDALLANSMKAAVKEVAGTCVSTGVSIEGVNAKDFFAEIDAGKYDDKLV